MRPLAVAFVAVVSVVAAPVPKKAVKDYQKLADEAEWQFAERQPIGEQLTAELKGYEVRAEGASGEETFTVRIMQDGKERAKIVTHLQATLRQRDGVVYHTDFSPWSSGCSLVAFDVKTNTTLWKCDLKGLGGIDHSKYRNEVRLEVLDDDTLRVFGKESAGRYMEIISRADGKTVGHRVFAEKK